MTLANQVSKETWLEHTEWIDSCGFDIRCVILAQLAYRSGQVCEPQVFTHPSALVDFIKSLTALPDETFYDQHGCDRYILGYVSSDKTPDDHITGMQWSQIKPSSTTIDPMVRPKLLALIGEPTKEKQEHLDNLLCYKVAKNWYDHELLCALAALAPKYVQRQFSTFTTSSGAETISDLIFQPLIRYICNGYAYIDYMGKCYMEPVDTKGLTSNTYIYATHCKKFGTPVCWADPITKMVEHSYQASPTLVRVPVANFFTPAMLGTVDKPPAIYTGTYPVKTIPVIKHGNFLTSDDGHKDFVDYYRFMNISFDQYSSADKLKELVNYYLEGQYLYLIDLQVNERNDSKLHKLALFYKVNVNQNYMRVIEECIIKVMESQKRFTENFK